MRLHINAVEIQDFRPKSAL